MIRLITLIKPYAKFILIAWLLTIIILSSLPNIPTLKIHTSKGEFRLDYLMHFCEYGLLTFMTFLSFAGNEFRVSYRLFLLITVSLILFAVLDELHQKLIPGRTYSLKDIASNVTGILAAAIFVVLSFRSIKIRLNKLK